MDVIIYTVSLATDPTALVENQQKAVEVPNIIRDVIRDNLFTKKKFLI